MAFRKKAGVILQYNPDILIVPECEHPDKLKGNIAEPTDELWFGSNINKGIGIFSYSKFRFRLLDLYNPELKMIIPVEVFHKSFRFILFAIWANNPNDKDGQYVEQIWKALDLYHEHLDNKKTILAGDFNSNSIWDRKYRISNHSNVVKRLAEKKIHSCYHLHYSQTHGREKDATLYMYRHQDKPYHLDYCFASDYFLKKMKEVQVGEYVFWKQYSDHVPLMVTFN